jgi:hypothetical protein
MRVILCPTNLNTGRADEEEGSQVFGKAIR